MEKSDPLLEDWVKWGWPFLSHSDSGPFQAADVAELYSAETMRSSPLIGPLSGAVNPNRDPAQAYWRFTRSGRTVFLLDHGRVRVTGGIEMLGTTETKDDGFGFELSVAAKPELRDLELFVGCDTAHATKGVVVARLEPAPSPAPVRAWPICANGIEVQRVHVQFASERPNARLILSIVIDDALTDNPGSVVLYAAQLGPFRSENTGDLHGEEIRPTACSSGPGEPHNSAPLVVISCMLQMLVSRRRR